MENKESVSILNKLQKEVESFGIKIKKDTIVEELKKVRAIALKLENPRMVKATRLTFEHVEAYEGFNIPMLSDEPIEGFEDSNLGNDTDIESNEEAQKESLLYLLSIMKDPTNRINASDLKEYNVLLKNYAELH
ncbi:MAG: hypothetical protein N4A35_00370 [Flavobacteriales bacterium]|nr:hypothetical protein [Flavobacteriales bacterium]